LLSRIGYWLRFDSTQEINVTGIPHRQDTIDVDAGWNLIGSVYGQIDTAASVTIPPAIRISNFFEYTTGYEAASTIRGGRGYWVKTTAAGKIVLPSSSRLEGPKR
jgi:hypothetical protein